MPANKDVKVIEPMYCLPKWGKEGSLTIREQLSNIKVTITDAPTVEQLKKNIPIFVLNGWNNHPRIDDFTEEEVNTCISQLFGGETIPNAMETVSISFVVEGLDLVDVTHLIRHRAFTFSAQCSDRDLRDMELHVKPSILAHEEFGARYRQIAELTQQLYADMMDSNEINVFDCRTILPVNKTHFYAVRGNIKDIISYIYQRKDEQIQPQSDNIVALKLWLEICKLYPFMKGLIDLKAQEAFFQKVARAGKTIIFPPNEKNDTFDWNPDQFFHTKHRDKFLASEVYLAIRDEIYKELEEL